jgi:nitrite reductase/ring-hydroxylating ferredoxin subunit
VTLNPKGSALDIDSQRAVKVCALSAVPDGGVLAVAAGRRDILLANVRGRIFAIDNLCSHASGWLDMGTLHAETMEIECPLHDGRFNLRNGQPTRPPCVEPQASYEVVVEGDDVFVVLPDAT